MSLDISFTQRRKNICPHCGEITGHTDVVTVDSGGGVWYPFLEEIGYYVPYEQRTEENDWYGKDMVLTKEQIGRAYKFVKENEMYNWFVIKGLLAESLMENDSVVVNADW